MKLNFGQVFIQLSAGGGREGKENNVPSDLKVIWPLSDRNQLSRDESEWNFEIEHCDSEWRRLMMRLESHFMKVKPRGIPFCGFRHSLRARNSSKKLAEQLPSFP
jgi:hypothetical protein